MIERYKVFQPSGIVDEQLAESLHQEIREANGQGYLHILIDMHNITFMNSSAVGTLVLVLKEVRNQGGDLYLCSLSDQVQVMLELSRMHLIFRCFSSIQEFEQKMLGSAA
ncbi:MAG: STAS domain-containing protein [Prochlorotrichaceae cyanobacterium]